MGKRGAWAAAGRGKERGAAVAGGTKPLSRPTMSASAHTRCSDDNERVMVVLLSHSPVNAMRNEMTRRSHGRRVFLLGFSFLIHFMTQQIKKE
jgi:hypothetical protein